jgi:hypothetical protein
MNRREHLIDLMNYIGKMIDDDEDLNLMKVYNWIEYIMLMEEGE